MIPWGFKFVDHSLPSDLRYYSPAEKFLESKKFCGFMHKWSGKLGPVPAFTRSCYYTFYKVVYNMNAPNKGTVPNFPLHLYIIQQNFLDSINFSAGP